MDAIKRAIDYIESGLPDLIEIYLEQANVFSAVVGIFGTKALDQVSNYEKNPNRHHAAGRFPDLCRRGHPSTDANHCLESKGSKRAWAIQSHYNHPGWYVVWRYLVDMTETIQPGKPVIIWPRTFLSSGSSPFIPSSRRSFGPTVPTLHRSSSTTTSG